MCSIFFESYKNVIWNIASEGNMEGQMTIERIEYNNWC